MGQLFGGTFSAALAAYLVYGQRFDASTTGFSLTMASAYPIQRATVKVANKRYSQLLLPDHVVGPHVQRVRSTR